MNVLTINAGSSSIRFAVFNANGESLSLLARDSFSGRAERPTQLLNAFLRQNGVRNVSVVAHRVVHGGKYRTASCLLDGVVEAEIGSLARLAPLHNPVALEWIAAARTALGPAVTQAAVFDTAFYATLPEVTANYALPRSLARKHGLRRYGFHGIAHRAMWQRWRTLRAPPRATAMECGISLQLGAGCSITAIRDGRAVDTSMGFSPLEGLVMATRSGDVDPGLLLYLMDSEKLSVSELEHLLNHESGLKGLSGMTGDMRTLLTCESDEARLAVETYCYRARKYIGAYIGALGGTQAILFGGGVGEHAPLVRQKILEGLEMFGIALDTSANNAAIGVEALVSARDSNVEVWVIPVDEGRILAEEAIVVLQTKARNAGRKG